MDKAGQGTYFGPVLGKNWSPEFDGETHRRTITNTPQKYPSSIMGLNGEQAGWAN